MERSGAFQPLTSSGTCPNLGLTCVSVACLTAMALGKKSLFTGNKLAVLPTALLGWGGGRGWLILLLRKLQLLGVCECCNSLLPNPTSFPQRWHFPTLALATWVFLGFVVPKQAEGSLEAAGPMLWLNPWGHLPGITIPCILRLHWRRLMTRFPVIDGSNDNKNKMLHHILAGVAQKDNSGSCLSSPSPLPLFPCTLAYGSCWGLKKKLCTVLFSSRHRGYHSSLENQGCKQAKGRWHILVEMSI